MSHLTATVGNTGFADLAVRAGLNVGDRVQATRCADPMHHMHENVTGVIETLMGASIAFRAEAPFVGYLMFAAVKDIETV